MDTGYTYGSPTGERGSIYLPPAFTPPDEITVVREDGATETWARVSDRELDCGEVYGVKGRCSSYECHRARLGFCQCGRHRSLGAPADDDRPPIALKRVTAR